MLQTQPEFALKLLEGMVNDKVQPSPAFAFILGNAYHAAGQVDKAEASYRSALKRYPTFMRGWGNLGVLYYGTNRFAEAIPCFSKSIILGDHEPATLGLLGYCLERTGNLVAAEMSYMQAMSGDPTNGDWLEGLLRIYTQGKQYDRAESLVKNLIKSHPKEARYWLTYANILLAGNRKLEAIAVLETSLGTEVAGVDELNLLADLYAEQQLIPEAVAIYQKILVPSPALGEQKLLNLAEVLIGDGKWLEAENALKALPATLSPDGRINFLQARANLLSAQKKWVDARKELKELLKLEPLNGKALLTLGRTYTAEEDLPHATFAFEAAFQIPNCTYRASLELANIELKNRHYDKSVGYLEKALSIERTSAVEDYLARVKTLLAKSS
jgi:tetratricopeptide (TPR) repeat protein